MFEHTRALCTRNRRYYRRSQKGNVYLNDHGNRASPLSPKELQGGESFIEHKQYAEVQPTKYYYDTDCFPMRSLRLDVSDIFTSSV